MSLTKEKLAEMENKHKSNSKQTANNKQELINVRQTLTYMTSNIIKLTEKIERSEKLIEDLRGAVTRHEASIHELEIILRQV